MNSDLLSIDICCPIVIIPIGIMGIRTAAVFSFGNHL